MAVALVITAESSLQVSTVFAVVVFTTIVSGLVIPVMIKHLYEDKEGSTEPLLISR